MPNKLLLPVSKKCKQKHKMKQTTQIFISYFTFVFTHFKIFKTSEIIKKGEGLEMTWKGTSRVQNQQAREITAFEILAAIFLSCKYFCKYEVQILKLALVC